ncbi:MAG TPA: 2-oxoglutarate dehydrogenase E1 component, partial [Alcanivorax sp.]|nr:2-oxoglutarate dehydrogenase E1 component [Alcanivorax sp.]
FLQLCAEHNMQICVPSTPAQIYHLLRRKAVRPLRKPLVIMSPKSLLRHKKAISTLEDLADGIFRTVLDDPAELDRNKVKRVVMCSGKVYYDLLEKRDSDELIDTALIRVEQLYPFPEQRLQEVLEGYPNLENLVWCQEEPMNQGAWYCSQHHMYRVAREVGDLRVHYAGRDMAAAPAAGSMALHVEQQQRLVQDAFEIK